MAITIDEQGGMSAAPRPTLAPRLAEYGLHLRKDRRRRYLGLAAVGIGLLWLGLAALIYFDAGFPLALPLGIGLTLLMPALALLYEGIRQPTALETARTLDALLDNRQRVLTSVELLDEGRKTKDEGPADNAKSQMERAQLSSTARLLGGIEPRALYPARVPVPQLAVATGLLVVAFGIWLLKGANDDFALASGGLPAGIDTAGVLATPTADAGLPPAPGAKADTLLPEGGEDTGASLPVLPPSGPSGESGDGSDSGYNPNPSVPADVAQQQADASREAEKSLQRLSRALDEQGVTQSIGDNLRQGDYDAAGDALSELGENNDQLSQDAKEALSESLDKAADDSAATPDLQQAERNAAEALRNGTYGEIKKALEELGETVKETGDNVVPQEDLAKNFPDQPATNPTPPASQNGQQDAGAEGEPGQDPGEQSGESGQPEENQGGISQPDAGSGDGERPEGSAGAPSDSSGGAPGEPNEQGQGSGAGEPGLPGEGSRVDGPRGQNLDAAGDPFELEGENQTDPNNLRPGDGNEPPAMTLEGDAGNSGSAQSPSQGGPVDATGETFPAPIDRWGILQRYFSPEGR